MFTALHVSGSYLFRNASSKIEEMAAMLAMQNFEYRYATLLLFTPALSFAVQLFLYLFNYNVALCGNDLNLPPYMTQQFVIYASGIEDIEKFIDKIVEREMDNTGMFIVICLSQKKTECQESEAMSLFWSYRITNVVFLKYDHSRVVAFTYFPISEGQCNNTKAVHLDMFHCINNKKNRCDGIFKTKFRSFQSCPLVVSSFIQNPLMTNMDDKPVGADGDLLQLIGYGLNSTIRMMSPQRGHGWGFPLDNGTWLGSLGDVDESIADISMTSSAITLTKFSKFQISKTYYFVTVVWVTHPPQETSFALKLLSPFGPRARSIMICSFVLVIVCAWALRTRKGISVLRKIGSEPPTKSVVFQAWMVCMGQSIAKFPAKRAFLHIIFLWISYSYLVRIFYQAQLTISLNSKLYEESFKRFKEALNAKYPYGGNPSLRDYFIGHPKLYNDWVNVDASDILQTSTDISHGKKFLLAMNLETVRIFIKEHKINLHILPEHIINSPTAIFLKRFSPLADPINLILNRLISAGFPGHLHKKYIGLRIPKVAVENKPLGTEHYASCYIILLVGWHISMFVFCLELYYGKMKQKGLVNK